MKYYGDESRCGVYNGIMINTKILTLNVQGMRGESRRKEIFYWLRSSSANIFCIQETH